MFSSWTVESLLKLCFVSHSPGDRPGSMEVCSVDETAIDL